VHLYAIDTENADLSGRASGCIDRGAAFWLPGLLGSSLLRVPSVALAEAFSRWPVHGFVYLPTFAAAVGMAALVMPFAMIRD
jgi:hypothetical protein